MLQQWGLYDNADAVYRVVLTQPGWDATRISAELGISEAQVQGAVDQLVELSLLHRSAGVLRPANPGIALHALLQRERTELLRHQERFVAVEETVNRLIDEYSELCAAGIRHGCDRLDGPRAVKARMEALACQARFECLSMEPGAHSEEALDSSRAIDDVLLDRGVAIRAIYQESACNHPSTLAFIRWLTQRQGEVRVVPTLPLWITIFDREVALVPVDPREVDKGVVEVFGAGFLTALVALFEQSWNSAACVGVEVPHCEDGVTAQERELLRLLAQGLTDECVSKKLGIGLRTHRRIVADLMERLGARSRFEAGVRAMERGWIGHDGAF
ncbi:helix-turn-helix transcriptional regulator [Nonomuraea sp. NPDC050786]|uniref:helix-turn-helix transcriptional regulator n=1 Tax=Nonomuraea sp. NPDC050786 TaxID=3154840 RepID=UPI003401B028